ncbi:MAG: carboxylating nicotinate-nucleotide diphosphorylase [Alphaproteobacteria bacterium]
MPIISQYISKHDIDLLILQILEEDFREKGDITSKALFTDPKDFPFKIVTREELVVAGLPIAERIFTKISPTCRFTYLHKDGDKVPAGTVLAEVTGFIKDVLASERTALNIVQHLSGIASYTRQFVEAIEGTNVILLDTRKTIPGLRKMAKYATFMGGAQNHRMGLYDGILVKDNHLAFIEKENTYTGNAIAEAVRRIQKAGHKEIEVECDTLEQVGQALEAGATRILLDNMSPETLRKAVTMRAEKAPDTKLEASGNVNLQTIRSIAETKVDYISVGRITLSAPAKDIGLDFD